MIARPASSVRGFTAQPEAVERKSPGLVPENLASFEGTTPNSVQSFTPNSLQSDSSDQPWFSFY
jgi:hypothetical protein